MAMITEYTVGIFILWSILMTGIVGSFCFVIWRITAHRMSSRGNAVQLYRWLKVTVLLWIFPIVFMMVCLYLGRITDSGGVEGIYFRAALIKNRTITNIVVLLWAVAAIIQMSRYLVRWIGHRRALRGLPRVMDPSWRAEAESIAKELGIRRRVDLREVPGIGSPMTVGLIRPIILLDGSIEEQEARRIILYHELYHYKQRDLWWQIWMSVMVCVNWFNPLCYRLHRELREWSEAACDARTCRQGAAEFSPKEYLYQVIAHCRPAKRTGGHFTRAINETGSVESFKNRVDRLFATMDSWETGNWRHWAKPAAYMIGSVGISAFLIYTAVVVRDYAVRKTDTVVDLGMGDPLAEFTVKPGKADDRLSKEEASPLPMEGTFKGNMREGIVLYRLCPAVGTAALDLSIRGDRGVCYEFGIFTEEGEVLSENFWNKGSTILELKEGKTYYIYVRDETEVTEDIVFMYYWRDPEWVKEYRATHSEGE